MGFSEIFCGKIYSKTYPQNSQDITTALFFFFLIIKKNVDYRLLGRMWKFLKGFTSFQIRKT